MVPDLGRREPAVVCFDSVLLLQEALYDSYSFLDCRVSSVGPVAAIALGSQLSFLLACLFLDAYTT